MITISLFKVCGHTTIKKSNHTLQLLKFGKLTTEKKQKNPLYTTWQYCTEIRVNVSRSKPLVPDIVDVNSLSCNCRHLFILRMLSFWEDISLPFIHVYKSARTINKTHWYCHFKIQHQTHHLPHSILITNKSDSEAKGNFISSELFLSFPSNTRCLGQDLLGCLLLLLLFHRHRLKKKKNICTIYTPWSKTITIKLFINKNLYRINIHRPSPSEYKAILWNLSQRGIKWSSYLCLTPQMWCKENFKKRGGGKRGGVCVFYKHDYCIPYAYTDALSIIYKISQSS